MLTDYSQLPLAERNVLRRLFTRPEGCTLEDWQRVGQLIVNAFRADVTRMGATKETDQLIAELSQQSVEFARFGKAMTSPVMEKAISALTTRRWVSSTRNLPPLPWRAVPIFPCWSLIRQRRRASGKFTVYFRGGIRAGGELRVNSYSTSALLCSESIRSQ